MRLAIALSLMLLCDLPVRAEPELCLRRGEVESHVRFEKMVGGYQIVLTRKASEMARTLGRDRRRQALHRWAKLAVKELNDPVPRRRLNSSRLS